MQRKTILKALGGILLGGMLLTGGMMAFANDTVTSTAVKNLPGAYMGMFFKGGRLEAFKSTLDKLVKDGVISQKKADDIKAYIEKRTNIFDELVQNNILTQKEADTLQSKIKEIAIKERQQKISDSLKSLVEKGIITQNQADKIFKKFEEIAKERKALFEKTKNMTWEERHQYMEENKEKLVDPLSQLVTDKVITEEQANTIREIIPHRGGHRGGFGRGFGGSFESGFRGGL